MAFISTAETVITIISACVCVCVCVCVWYDFDGFGKRKTEGHLNRSIQKRFFVWEDLQAVEGLTTTSLGQQVLSFLLIVVLMYNVVVVVSTLPHWVTTYINWATTLLTQLMYVVTSSIASPHTSIGSPHTSIGSPHTSIGSVSFTRTVNTVLWVEMNKSCVMKLST